MQLSISRYNPEVDDKPYMQDYEIELVHTDHMLLDVLLRLKRARPYADDQKVLPRRRLRV